MFIIPGSILIKESAPVGTRIAKLVVTDQRSSKLEKDLIFSLVIVVTIKTSTYVSKY